MPSPLTTEFHVTGMTCNNCARKVTEAAQKISGVHSVNVSVTTERASVRWNSADAKNSSSVITAISQAGFAAKEISADSNDSAKPNRWHWTLIVGLTVTVLLMIGEWGFHLMMEPWFQWSSFALAAVVQVYCGAQFYRGAWRQLKVGASNMDTLVALGSTTAFGYSTWALFSGHGGHVYFMEAAAIISLVSFGHWLEARVSEKASSALKSLMQLAPQTARRIQSPKSEVQNPASQPFNLKTLNFSKSEIRNPKSETEIEVPVSTLQINDRIALRPGDRVPVDGVVLEGESAVDEAMLTGESVPVDKETESKLYAGTVNLNGRLVMRVTATGESTALAHIIAAVQRAQTSRADIQRLGDRISNIFVPIIVAIALAAGIFWFVHSGAEKAFVIAAGILIVACPCAMGLATPAAIMAAANTAARRGFLIRDGVALEKAGKISAVIFDKTGTLTEGKPKVIAEKYFPMNVPAELKPIETANLAASLASHSNHPLSKAVTAFRKPTNLIGDFTELSGRGIKGLLNLKNDKPHILQLGSLEWLSEEGVSCDEAMHFAYEWMDKGSTVIGLSANLELIGVFALRDTLKPSAAQVINKLDDWYWRKGHKVYIVSGDNSRTVRAIADELHVSFREPGGEHEECRVIGEVRPEQKAEFIKKLQARGERVAFVGDGINDAPALTQADLGIAVSRASDVAREAADIILLKSEIEAVPEALGLARATLRTIKQNLFWAFFYNALGVPLAACGIISPVFCAAAMGFSDLIVIGNALRLLRWKQ